MQVTYSNAYSYSNAHSDTSPTALWFNGRFLYLGHRLLQFFV